MGRREVAVVAILALTVGCADSETDTRRASETEQAGDRPAQAAMAGSATARASDFSEPSPEELEAGRLDPSWRQFAEADVSARRTARGGVADPPDAGAGDSPDTTAPAAESAPPSESADTATRSASQASEQAWDDIAAETVNTAVAGTIGGDVAGPAVARLQILLDRAGFSPGVIDGRWGKNTEKAVYWFQNEQGLEPTGEADESTMQRLEQAADLTRAVRSHTLTEDDVAGPFVPLPEDIYERADQSCLCYESLREKLGEVFHATPELLEQLNPDVDLGAVAAGDRLDVPDVGPFHVDALPEGGHQGRGEVARILISDGGHYLHALDENGNIIRHFPSTLGADYAPSPSGELSVSSITFGPTWHYQPGILTGVDPSEEDAVLPPGPNNAVGIVWMQLSREHYGIHGTASPASIGYASSNGCVRLTNWDAEWLGRAAAPDTPVEFRDVDGREG